MVWRSYLSQFYNFVSTYNSIFIKSRFYHDVERYEKEIHHMHVHNLIDFEHLCRDASTAARQIIKEDKR